MTTIHERTIPGAIVRLNWLLHYQLRNGRHVCTSFKRWFTKTPFTGVLLIVSCFQEPRTSCWGVDFDAAEVTTIVSFFDFWPWNAIFRQELECWMVTLKFVWMGGGGGHADIMKNVIFHDMWFRLRSCFHFAKSAFWSLKYAVHGSTVYASLEKKTISWACTAHCSRLLFELKWTGKAFIWRHLNVVITWFCVHASTRISVLL